MATAVNTGNSHEERRQESMLEQIREFLTTHDKLKRRRIRSEILRKNFLYCEPQEKEFSDDLLANANVILSDLDKVVAASARIIQLAGAENTQLSNSGRKKIDSLGKLGIEIVSVFKSMSGILLNECVRERRHFIALRNVVDIAGRVFKRIRISITEGIALNVVELIIFIREVSNLPFDLDSFVPGKLVGLAGESGADVNMVNDINTSRNRQGTPFSKAFEIEDREHREATIRALLACGAEMFRCCEGKRIHTLFPGVIIHFTELETEEAISAVKLFQRSHLQPELFFGALPNGSTWMQNFLRCISKQYDRSSTNDVELNIRTHEPEEEEKQKAEKKNKFEEKLTYLLKEGTDFNSSGEWDEPPVIIAASDMEITSIFLNVCGIKSPLKVRGWFNRSVLHVSSDVTTIEELGTKYVAEVNALDFFQRTPLMYVVSSADCQCCRPSKFEIFAGNLVSLCRCTDDCVNRMRALLDLGADLSFTDQDGVSVVHLAATTHPRVLEILLSYSTLKDVSNILDRSGSSPLHYAVFANSIECVKMLLSFGLDSNVRDQNGNTPLDTAKLFGYGEISELLQAQIESGEELNQLIHQPSIFQVRSKITANVIHYNAQYIEQLQRLSPEDAGLKMLLTMNLSMTENDYDAILNSPFLGCKKLDEAKEVNEEVESLVRKLSFEIEAMKPEFAFRIKMRGSSKEGTKIGFPDEFDFNLIMMNMDDPVNYPWTSMDDYPEIEGYDPQQHGNRYVGCVLHVETAEPHSSSLLPLSVLPKVFS